MACSEQKITNNRILFTEKIILGDENDSYPMRSCDKGTEGTNGDTERITRDNRRDGTSQIGVVNTDHQLPRPPRRSKRERKSVDYANDDDADNEDKRARKKSGTTKKDNKNVLKENGNKDDRNVLKEDGNQGEEEEEEEEKWELKNILSAKEIKKLNPSMCQKTSCTNVACSVYQSTLDTNGMNEWKICLDCQEE